MFTNERGAFVDELLSASGEWEIVNFTSTNDAVILDGIGCTLSLADVYESIELDAI